MSKPRIVPGPHYIWTVIGTDGSFISETYWWEDHAKERCPRGCRVEKFRLVRVAPKRRKQKKAVKK